MSDTNDGERDADDPCEPEQPAKEATPPPPRAAPAGPPGLRVGDFVLSPTVSTSTDDRHDDWRIDERRRGEEEDARAAQQSGVGAPSPPDPLHPAPTPIAPRSELDDALDAARAKAAGTDAELPIIFHDPITGAPIFKR